MAGINIFGADASLYLRQSLCLDPIRRARCACAKAESQQKHVAECQIQSDKSRPGHSLEVARRADVGLGQPLFFAFVLLLLPERGVHDVVHLRVVKTVSRADLGVFDVHGGHGQRRAWKTTLRGGVNFFWARQFPCQLTLERRLAIDGKFRQPG